MVGRAVYAGEVPAPVNPCKLNHFLPCGDREEQLPSVLLEFVVKSPCGIVMASYIL